MITFEDKRKRREIFVTVLIILLFAISLYLVEWSGIGARSVGQYNGGYGTFDMKPYSPQIVDSVLQQMEPKGFEIYKKYYAADFLIVLTFCPMQILLLNWVFGWRKRNTVHADKQEFTLKNFCLKWLEKLFRQRSFRYALWSVPVLRGVFDSIENCILLSSLNSYPVLSEKMIEIASVSTELKLLMIKIWAFFMLVGIARRILIKTARKKMVISDFY